MNWWQRFRDWRRMRRQEKSIKLLDYWLERASDAYGLYEREATDAESSNDLPDFTGLTDDPPSGMSQAELTKKVYDAMKNYAPNERTEWYFHPDIIKAALRADRKRRILRWLMPWRKI